ncbi:succinate semialdehyde dehydrogenase [Hasllibacter halocynthiae]|uniref:Succinate semialdehyde dehydrogenase n=1 Tax=Hasllibacter halocynthiae TaxID=595589 RepID=A0A2T0X1C3_9RHOB|nr:NAD-dependent succinate-semialdehyde dehydrogenase [Hasllibacter halocynthiae]PRY92717.1 succinate semialdehyde dehydrogenase [Hasllibacter halocynthiae]
MPRDETTNLPGLLGDRDLLRTRLFDGEWRDAEGGAVFPVTNPARGDVIAEVADATRADAARAIERAHAAQAEWAATTAKHRAQVLRRWFDLMMAAQDDLATILTAEQGKPLAEAKGEIAYAASFIEFFAEEAKRVTGEIIPGHMPDKRIHVIRQPVGVVASITPWNFPSAMITRKAAPALAAGCAFVAKPAAETPLSATALAVLAERAGIPAGLLAVLPSTDAEGMGHEFTQNDRVRKLTFTGSTPVGRILLRQAADRVMKVSMELGGNAPFIVFDDADLDAAVEGAIACKFRNNGQTCVCANRLYVQSGIHDAFVEAFAKRVRAMTVGDGMEGADLGPLITGEAVEKVEAHLADAKGKGARVVTGGAPSGAGPLFYQPTIVTDVTRDMRFNEEETFGPFAPVYRFEDEDEVIALANDTIYGLAAYFYAKDLGRVTKVSEALEYGIVGVNTGIISTEVAPFGGVKQSGLGREGSTHGIDEFLEMKYVCLSI